MKVAVVVDWLTDAGGAESVFSEALKVFPGASVHALVDQMSDADHARLGIPRARVSWLQAVVGPRGDYRPWLPLMPAAARSLTFGDADVVLAISHAVAQHVTPRPRPGGAAPRLLCLSLSPMRYAWDLRGQYLAESGLERGIRGALANLLLDRMQAADRAASRRVHAYAAISRYIADRIRRAYGRESAVIYPPVDTEFYRPGPPAGSRPPAAADAADAPYVTASRLVPYKRVDLVVRAFAGDPRRQLVVVGDGPARDKVRAAAGGAGNVTFLGHVGRDRLRDELRRARAFVFAAEEDFGIAPLEAQACGVPVIAYGQGGVLETVVPPGGGAAPTGLFFPEQTAASIATAVAAFEAAPPGAFSPEACRRNAERFAAARFRDELRRWVVAAAHAPHAPTAGAPASPDWRIEK